MGRSERSTSAGDDSIVRVNNASRDLSGVFETRSRCTVFGQKVHRDGRRVCSVGDTRGTTESNSTSGCGSRRAPAAEGAARSPVPN